MIIEDLLQTVLHEKKLQHLVTEDGKLWNAIIEFAKRYHEQQVKSVGLADVGGSLLDEIVSALKKKQRGYEISKVWPASEAYKDAIGIVNSKKQ